MRLLLLADFHLGARLVDWGSHARKRRDEIRAAWKEAVDTALADDRKVDAVLVAGDLFDTPCPEAEDLTPVLEGLGRLAKAGTPVVLLAGYFDGAYHPGCVYHQDLFPASVVRVTWAEAKRISIPAGEETLHLYSRAPLPATGSDSVSRTFEKSKEPGYHVGLFYEVPAEESPGGAWRPVMDREALKELGLDLVVMGGYHNFGEETAGTTPMVFPGTPVGLKPGEWDERYWVLAELSESGAAVEKRARRVPPVKKIIKNVHEQGIESPDGLVEELAKENNGGGMLVVELGGELGSVWDEDKVVEKCSSLPSAVILEDTTTLSTDSGALGELKEEDSVAGRFVKEIEQIEDESGEDVANGALRLGLQEFRRLEGDHAS